MINVCGHLTLICTFTHYVILKDPSKKNRYFNKSTFIQFAIIVFHMVLREGAFQHLQAVVGTFP